MKLQELNYQQLAEINGGNDGSSTTSVGATISTDTLLQLDYSSSNGSDSYQSSLVLGRGIHTGVGTNNNSSNR